MTADLTALTSWHAPAWRGLKAGVLGAAVVGFAAADTLVELGCEVLVVGERATEERTTLLDVIGARLALGDATAQRDALEAFAPDLLVVSPGYHPDVPALAWAAEAGVPVVGDVELAWRLRDKTGAPAEWITITGTNGKTTTTQLTTAMLLQDGRRARACGNIGSPVLDAIREPDGWDVLVVELSSYQLHWLDQTRAEQVSPVASVCLNIADDHLDWHGSAEAYRAAKGKVYERTRLACVYNVEDAVTEQLVRDADVVEGCRAVGFTRGVPRVSEVGIVEEVLVDRAFLEQRRTSALELTTVDALHEAGLSAPHVVADVLAASALARAVGVEPRAIRDALAAFRLDAHRIEPVGEVDGVRFVDDSKATNPHAAAASLAAFERVVWIAGGLTKGVDVEPLVAAVAGSGRLSGAVVIGRDPSAFEQALARHAPGVPVVVVPHGETGGVMPLAVEAARTLASDGDVVLLAPAAASMDQFTDYADRGARFAAAVRDAIAGAGGPPAP
ncbi:UDP-N-acetylmuramoyl-L-alanine--D-glutamate ligase [Amnibacterium soli]|uniref:UDP-N-acetylmuramoylalanine--D-glutamate ligase n=1 Tax=Amnibacterium soli TaxID=1282736 RepID=A0ABP8YXU3_9MICO